MDRMIRINATGEGPTLVTGAGAARPVPGPGEVAVRLHAAALNFADLQMAEGR